MATHRAGRWSRYFFINLLVSLILLVMSVIFLGMGISQFESGRSFETALPFGLFELALGSVGAYVSYNMLSSTLKIRRSASTKIPEKLVTVETCSQCGYKEERAYAEGDYVRKETAACPKCSTIKKISAVFVEKPVTPTAKPS